MKRRTLVFTLLMALFVSPMLVEAQQSTKKGVIVPAYIYPTTAKEKLTVEWDILRKMSLKYGKQLVVVANPSNGPGNAKDENYEFAINQIKAAGGIVIGYVHTCYALTSPSANCQGRTQGDVTVDVDNWKEWYNVDGIFVDEASSANSQDSIAWLKGLNEYIGKKFGWEYNVNNFGTVPPRGYWADHGVIRPEIEIVMEQSVAFYETNKNNLPTVEYNAGVILHTGRYEDLTKIKPEITTKKIY